MTALNNDDGVFFEVVTAPNGELGGGYSEREALAFLAGLDVDHVLGLSEPLVAAADVHSGAMIALLPSAADAQRLAVEDGEDESQLHVTLAYLGKADAIDGDTRTRIIAQLERLVSDVISTEAFAVSTFNPHNPDKDTCVVLGIGNESGQQLVDVRSSVLSALNGVPGLALPEQHSPWVPHITLAYSDDEELPARLRDRAGPLTLDRLRIAFAGEFIDLPLGTVFSEGVESSVETTTAAAAGKNSGDCGPGQHVTPNGTCMDDEKMTYADEEWNGPVAVEGVETGDGRLFSMGSLDWAPLPLPLMYQPTNIGGHSGSFMVGEITHLGRRGNEIYGWGTVFGEKLASEHGESIRQMLRVGGVSVDVDKVKDADVEYIYSDGGEAGPVAFGKPELTVFHRGRIRGATLVAFPAFVEAELELTGEPGVVVASAEGNSYTITIPNLPPREWFDDPTDVEMHGALTVTAEGRVYGILAPTDTTHRSVNRRAPTGNVDYARWMKGETIVADGGRVTTGVITMNCGHAPVHNYGSLENRVEHYDNSCSVVANARIYEDRVGRQIRIAGALAHGVTSEQVTRMQGCTLSGDWQPHPDRPGVREFIAALLVPVPGFPMARTKPSVEYADGVITASTIPVHFVETSTEAISDVDTGLTEVYDRARQVLARSIGCDYDSRLSELKSRMGVK